jgi:hypothetical protein
MLRIKMRKQINKEDNWAHAGIREGDRVVAYGFGDTIFVWDVYRRRGVENHLVMRRAPRPDRNAKPVQIDGTWYWEWVNDKS